MLTGSHNWSNSANVRNDENTLIIHDQDIANQYFQEWMARFDELGGEQGIIPFDPVVDTTGDTTGGPMMVSYVAGGNWIKVYPNPSSDYIIIKTTGDGRGLLSIYDLEGKLEYEMVFPEMNQPIYLPANNLSDGLHFLRIHQGNQLCTFRIVIE